MTSATELAPMLRQLIDARLDAIERVLLSTQMTRVERGEIVQSVEGQIYELLGRHADGEPTRESILEVLATLDPPEAYFDPQFSTNRRATSEAPQQISENRKGRLTPLAVISCVLGVLCLLSIVIWPVSVIAGIAAAVCGSIALTQIYYVDYVRGVWPSVVGVCAPAIAMLTFLILAM